MATFKEWCEHYDYDPATDTAKADYERYLEQMALSKSLFKNDVKPELIAVLATIRNEACYVGSDNPKFLKHQLETIRKMASQAIKKYI